MYKPIIADSVSHIPIMQILPKPNIQNISSFTHSTKIMNTFISRSPSQQSISICYICGST